MKRFLQNLFIIAVFIIGLYILVPDMMRVISQTYVAMFGTGLLILLIIIAAIPRRR